MTETNERRMDGDADPRDIDELLSLFGSGHAAVTIVTSEEREAFAAVRAAAEALGSQLWCWTVLDGVFDVRKGADKAETDTTQPAAALYWLGRQRLPSVIALMDIGDHCEDAHVRRGLRALIEIAREVGSHVVMIDHGDGLPSVVRTHAAKLELHLPNEERIDAVVRKTLRALNRERAIDLDVTRAEYAVMLKNLLGLNARQATQVIRDVVVDDLRLDADDLNRIMARKRQLVAGEGALEYVESPTGLDDVGGLTHLKAWLSDRAGAFDEKAEAYGLRPPRGVLMLGVQGAGKSLCAKAVATAWGRPLLRLDPGSLYDRYVGESEKRLRDALRQAEAMAPVVLWIDEIEKGFASAAAHSTDGGLSQRMFGALLTWMQDHTSPVFAVATANNIEALPPELLRKGRFDEIFFVDLPGDEARRKIFEIHLRKRQRDPAGFDLAALSNAADGFSGAEIEQAIIGALHAAYAAGSDVSTADIVKAVEESVPLSVTMGEDIDRLRRWAEDRCVPAG